MSKRSLRNSMPKSASNQTNNGATLGYEAELFKAADKLRGNMEPSDYKHVVLGLIFLKHISNRFAIRRKQLETEYPDGVEDRDEYTAENVFWLPPAARWSHLQANAKQPTIGKLIDEAMVAIEKENASLKGSIAEGIRPSGVECGDAGGVDRFDLEYCPGGGAGCC